MYTYLYTETYRYTIYLCIHIHMHIFMHTFMNIRKYSYICIYIYVGSLVVTAQPSGDNGGSPRSNSQSVEYIRALSFDDIMIKLETNLKQIASQSPAPLQVLHWFDLFSNSDYMFIFFLITFYTYTFLASLPFWLVCMGFIFCNTTPCNLLNKHHHYPG
jgi:hypothetical protein